MDAGALLACVYGAASASHGAYIWAGVFPRGCMTGRVYDSVCMTRYKGSHLFACSGYILRMTTRHTPITVIHSWLNSSDCVMACVLLIHWV